MDQTTNRMRVRPTNRNDHFRRIHGRQPCSLEPRSKTTEDIVGDSPNVDNGSMQDLSASPPQDTADPAEGSTGVPPIDSPVVIIAEASPTARTASPKRKLRYSDRGTLVPQEEGKYYDFEIPRWRGTDHTPECLRELLDKYWIRKNIHKVKAVLEHLLVSHSVPLSKNEQRELQDKIDEAMPSVIWDQETLSQLSNAILYDYGSCTSQYKQPNVELTEKCQDNALHIFEPNDAFARHESHWSCDIRDWRRWVDSCLKNPSKMMFFPDIPVRGDKVCGGSSGVWDGGKCYEARRSPLGICDARVIYCFESVPGLDLEFEYERWDWRRFEDCPEAFRKDFVRKAMRVYDVLHVMKLQKDVGSSSRDHDVLQSLSEAQKDAGIAGIDVDKTLPEHVRWARGLITETKSRERGAFVHAKDKDSP